MKLLFVCIQMYVKETKHGRYDLDKTNLSLRFSVQHDDQNCCSEISVVLYLQGREKFRKAAQEVQGNILSGQASLSNVAIFFLAQS